ncbi:hypothetical protein CHLNCDRAFT_50559 [Chlorella variabilis]|uniref:G-patch domain-containing protein n=1 Tax=Chlorella variabilis TaxID=554065 RepID=E1Z7F2_CHLVA|nr:hypothetical protein CHLNCDRAFT_50559 [Chlorella variabilis]EFN58159.1 hypothetical protein CHLNCDRAFT_50559 [Chlorella variabilis]|eukprot:XP_005850261.1 hypothetical protein CHLNCDRAFT_50559 [Chlorella variabilis]
MAHLDEEQHYEKLDMDNDFEGGEFIGSEFFHRGKRQRKQQTADDRLYGIFADDSDDEHGGRRKGGPGGGKRADYSKPVSFVGGGVVQHGPEDADKQQQGAEEAPRRGLGAGAGSGLGFAPAGAGAGVGAAAGAGFGPAPAPKAGHGGIGFAAAGGGGGIGFSPAGGTGGIGVSPAGGGGGGLGSAGGGGGGGPPGFAKGHASLHEEEEEEEEALLPTAFGRRIQAGAEQRRKQSEAAARVERSKVKAAVGPKADVGKFEAHTKGIGAKLLAKMGWAEGEGLGRDRRGISKPLEAKLRPKGMGMGFGDYTEHKLVAEDKEAAAAAAKDKKGEEMESEQKPAAVERQTIIDMRGPQARLVTNLEHLNVEEDRGDGGSVPMPELQHNMRLLVDLAENDIQRLDAKMRHEKDTAVILGKEQERLEEEARLAAAAAERLEAVLAAVARAANEPLSLAELEGVYHEVRGQYREEYVMYNLAAAALAQALPRLAQLMQQWSPLGDPGLPVAEFAGWRPLLESEGAAQGSVLGGGGDLAGGGDAYMRLVAELVLPPLRKELANDWDPRQGVGVWHVSSLVVWDAARLERFVEAWEAVLPGAALQYIMESLVLPRLRLAVQAWDPLRDTVALHTWVHPWLPFLGAPMAELWPVIRFKFANALQAWHPSDQSAHVFEPKDWEQLLARSIVPKLAFALQELVINPLHQELEPFNWVLAWQDVMSVNQASRLHTRLAWQCHMASLFEQYFFPKWHAVLHHWLANSPNYDEVTRWYLGWKSLFPQDLLDHERIRAQLSAALNLMNSAVDGGPPPSSWTAPQVAAGGGPAAPPLPPTLPTPHYDASDLTLRQLVEQYAEETGVAFLPKPGRTHEGLQMYGFGLVSCVVDNAQSLVKAQLGDQGWATVSLEQLLQEHERRQKAKAKPAKK